MAYTVGFVGFGNLAKRLYAGFSPLFKQENVTVLYSERFPLTPPISDVTLVSLTELLTQSDIIILAIKPHQLTDILAELNTVDWNQKCLVSLLAGKSLSTISAKIKNITHLIRVMPNTSAEFKESMTVYSTLKSTSDIYIQRIDTLFNSVGTCIKTDDSKMDLCTGLFGSGPAFFYELLAGMQRFMTKQGFNETTSRTMINQLMLGIATSVNKRQDSIDTLIKEIKSPNGTTQAGLEKMEELNLTSLFENVFNAAKNRAKELSDE
jgi:pyrroline-5-carboxylate reductase